MDERLVDRAVGAALNARRVFKEDEGDPENAVGELIESVIALCRLVVGDEQYKAASEKVKKILESDDDE